MEFKTLTHCKNLMLMLAVMAFAWLVQGQSTADPTATTDPALFFAIIVVVAIIAVILIGAVISLVIICVVYYCCTPVPNPDHIQVRTNPNPDTNTPDMQVLDALPPDYEDHDKYPRSSLSQRSRASLPRYSLIFKKTRRDRSSSQRDRTSQRPGGVGSASQSLPDTIVVPTETSQTGENTV